MWRTNAGDYPTVYAALKDATNAEFEFYDNDELRWVGDLSRPLQDFACNTAHELLEDILPEPVPIYMVEPPSEIQDPQEAANFVAKRFAEGAMPIPERGLPAPRRDFLLAVVSKQRWLEGELSDEDLMFWWNQLQVLLQSQWPSGFCLQINMTHVAESAAAEAVRVGEPWSSALACAQAAILFEAGRETCQAFKCDSTAHNTKELVWEAAQFGVRCMTRGIGCPQSQDQDTAHKAAEMFDEHRGFWAQRVAQELEEFVLTKIGLD